MRSIFLGLLLIGMAGCSIQSNPPLESNPEAEPSNSVQLKDLGEAPELTNTVWLNTDTPLRLADLRGKVVLLEMWTFG